MIVEENARTVYVLGRVLFPPRPMHTQKRVRYFHVEKKNSIVGPRRVEKQARDGGSKRSLAKGQFEVVESGDG